MAYWKSHIISWGSFQVIGPNFESMEWDFAFRTTREYIKHQLEILKNSPVISNRSAIVRAVPAINSLTVVLTTGISSDKNSKSAKKAVEVFIVSAKARIFATSIRASAATVGWGITVSSRSSSLRKKRKLANLPHFYLNQQAILLTQT